ncbi:hypothetical protein ACFRQM_41040 [Streptomyces sp. NPDC056831]|uniref:hypothetical protein n=1 Tax=Streptomyces sp. NPDC056831 TaxID=3345954 RepID=UPI0036CDB11B
MEAAVEAFLNADEHAIENQAEAETAAAESRAEEELHAFLFRRSVSVRWWSRDVPDCQIVSERRGSASAQDLAFAEVFFATGPAAPVRLGHDDFQWGWPKGTRTSGRGSSE